ncbi:Gfo/Idh/MocA family oxidoreductase [Desulfotalea psychrophila]|uniref:Uncharacterized protein n=1 Tax=Desulfotalea psychrophila (strain LSv54 / DSM 12343) TaxID=177439 RepID=Q6ALV9_DESPS|nr:Gfo/Idh/MocA family oxidoreductase [Desulfotalea psychrophila]CAG36666.1 hypothetical protein DP1937 [Desulfotalea psychrophila LSv54]
MKIIKAAVIGVGYLGRFHAQKYAALEGVELVGVVDPNGEQAKAVAEECSCKAFTDYHALLDLVDVVSIVVPTSSHYDVAHDCLQAGIDVLLEKPMTVTLKEADELIAIANEKNLILQIGHLERFNPAIIAMQPFLNKPVFVESHRVATFKNRATDVDVVLDLMIHDIDIILSIVQSPLESIHSIGAQLATKTTDIANARLVFKNGAAANVSVSRVSSGNSRKMRVFQQNSFINIDFASRVIAVTEFTSEKQQDVMPESTTTTKVFEQADALKSEIETFLGHTRSRSLPAVSGKEGRNALAVAQEVIAQVKATQQKPAFL